MPPNGATGPDWARDAVFYHIYPLGLCGAPSRNDFATAPEPRLAQLHGWIDHLRRLGVNALYLGPLFASSAHGYDTADYWHVDGRLGTDDTLAGLVAALRAAGIRVILDGVFHHVGREFWAFRDLRENGEHSPYRDWFAGINFAHRSPYGDPFTYDAWRGHYDLVKLNLSHPDVRSHLFGAVASWVERFGIDGLRLDVAESIDLGFLRDLAAFCRRLRPDLWLLGEVIHGDYRRWAGPGMLDSVTNYECYKGLYSSHNDRNYHEIAHSLARQFGDGGVYRGLPLYNFADNHDVNRVASTLRNPAHLYPLHLLLLTMPGVPSIYAGSEWGIAGVRGRGDDGPLRPPLRLPESAATAPHPDLAPAIGRLARLRHDIPALRHGSYRQLLVTSEQLAFARRTDREQAIVVANASQSSVRLTAPIGPDSARRFTDRLNGGEEFESLGDRLEISVPPCWGRVLTPS